MATLILKEVDLELLRKQYDELVELAAGDRNDYDALIDIIGMFNRYFNDPEPVTVAVVIVGGLLQVVVADDPAPGLQILLIDYDLEGADEEDIIQVPQMVVGNTRTVGALACINKVMQAGIDIQQTLKNVEEHDAKEWGVTNTFIGKVEGGSDAAGDRKDQTGDS